MEKGRKSNSLLPFGSLRIGAVSLALALGGVFAAMPVEMNAQSTQTRVRQKAQGTQFRGTVIDDAGETLPGVSVTVKGHKNLGTVTDAEGNFRISVPGDKCILCFSYVGMKPQEMRVTSNRAITVRLEPNAEMLKEVVANGIYTRNIESFTGSVSTFNKDDLKMMGNVNVLRSLKALDPSIIMPDNNLMGSDPNTMAKISINGDTNVGVLSKGSGSLTDTDLTTQSLAQEYETDPNQPLFILDGFESTLQVINDLNMDRVESISILKDASATAIYGSKAANGVIVVETKKPEAGRLQLSYNGSFQVAWADLSDFNLMNSEQKLQYELLSGVYNGSSDSGQISGLGPDGLPVQELYRQRYFDKLRLVQEGYDTYWMNEPLRTAITQTHNIYIQGGDHAFRYGAGLSYNKNEGIMKGSDRNVVNGNITLSYRVDNFNFTNQTTISNTKSEQEKVEFSRFSEMNPFFPKRDENGKVPKYSYRQVNGESVTTYWNPLWDMSQSSFRKGDITSITDNFQFEWRIIPQLRLRGNLQYQLSKNTQENFTSPEETGQATVDISRRGSYINTNSTSQNYSGRVNVTYGMAFGDHTINAVGGMQFSDKTQKSYRFSAQGYTSDKFSNPNFSNGYPSGGKPSSTETKSRSASYYANVNYSYRMRYLLDFNLSYSGASQFGIDDPFTKTWSVGAGWNIHNEKWFDNSKFVSNLKLRVSYGNPGNQNYDAKLASSIYTYFNEYSNPFTLAALISQWGNSGLKWEKADTYNVGINGTILDNRLSFTADYQIRKSNPKLVRIDLPSSTGTTSAPVNLGGTDNRSISGSLTFYIIRKYDFNWYVSANASHTTTKYYNIGNTLEEYNEAGRASKSLTRMYDGASISGMYAVRSLGIDPATGYEIYLKKNGAATFKYDSDDEVLVGDSNPDVQGNVSTSFVYKGLSLGANFSFRCGAETVLSTLMDKVENISDTRREYNQDVRALTDRWKRPGDISKFKRIDDTSTSNVTTRFIKTENTLQCTTINVGYRTTTASFLNAIQATSFDIRFYMNDIFRISNIKEERGTNYPFQRSFSLSIGLGF